MGRQILFVLGKEIKPLLLFRKLNAKIDDISSNTVYLEAQANAVAGLLAQRHPFRGIDTAPVKQQLVDADNGIDILIIEAP